MTWWRFWSDVFIMLDTTVTVKRMIRLILPCHEDWKHLQQLPANDNGWIHEPYT